VSTGPSGIRCHDRLAGLAVDVAEATFDRQLAALEQQMKTERLQLSFAPDAIRELRAELACVGRTLERNYTYFLPFTRRRLKAQSGALHRRIALQALELEELRERHPQSVSWDEL